MNFAILDANVLYGVLLSARRLHDAAAGSSDSAGETEPARLAASIAARLERFDLGAAYTVAREVELLAENGSSDVVMRSAYLQLLIEEEIAALESSALPVDPSSETVGTPRPDAGSRSSRALVHAAAALLPAASRERYREEWSGELQMLPRRHRLVYGVRLLAQSFTMRRAVRPSLSHMRDE